MKQKAQLPEFKEKGRLKSREWRKKYPDKANEFVKNSKAKNINKYKKLTTEWRQKNEAKYKAMRIAIEARRRARLREAEGTHTGKQIEELYLKQKARCAEYSCKNSLRKGYHADHIHPLSKGGSNDITNIQLLCPQCNRKKNAKDAITWARCNGRLL